MLHLSVLYSTNRTIKLAVCSLSACKQVFLFMQKMLDSVPSQHLPDICSTIVKASFSEKIQVLDAVDLAERFKTALPLLMRQIEVSVMF